MKKILYSYLFLIFIFMSVLVPCKVYAVDITVGATTWYAWWNEKQSGDSETLDPALLYGPVLSVRFFDDFDLTFVYLTGKFDDGSNKKIQRYDFDFAFGYRLNDFFKVFTGLKYMGYKQGSYRYDSFAPELGLKATLPIAENLFLIPTLSGFYLLGSDIDNSVNRGENFNGYGVDSSLSFAYYITPAININLGGRLIYYKTNWKPDSYSPPLDDITTKIYGVILSASFTF